MRVVVTGSHGLIGSALVDALTAQGHEVTRLVRREPGPSEARWDPQGGTIDVHTLEGHDAVVNLAGEGIGDHRWTAAHKQRVRDSRVLGTTLLARTLAGLASPPAVLASGSAIGFYGNRGDEELTEASPSGDGFLASIAREWEAATSPAADAGIRVALLRTGIVLSPRGGALAPLLLPFRLGLGGRIGTGRQWFSWISLDDEVRAIIHVLSDAEARGPVNLTAPSPVRNAELAKTLGRVLRRPAVLPTPRLALDLRLGREGAREMVLEGQRVVPAVLQTRGFDFGDPDLEGALRRLLA